MTAAARFTKALAGQWSATLYAAVLSTLLAFALGRVLGPETFGEYTFVLTIASMFAILQDGGFATLIFRETARPTDQLIQPEPILRSGLGHVCLVTGLGMAAAWLLPLEQKPALFMALAYYALFCAGNFLSAWLKGHGQFELEGKWRMATRTGTALAVGLTLLLPSPGAATVFAGWLVGQMIVLALPMAAPLRRTPILTFSSSLYGSCGAFLLISAATTLYFKSDIILLGLFTGDKAQVGQYAAAYRLIEAATLFSTPLTHLFFRSLRLNLHQPAAFKRSLRLMLTVMCLLALAGTAFSLWLGPRIIALAFGPAYGQAGELCFWLLPSLLFILPNGLLTQALVALGREGYYARLAVAMAVVNIGLNALLIPFLGAKGSGLATICTEALLTAGLALGLAGRTGAKGGQPRTGQTQQTSQAGPVENPTTAKDRP